MIAEFVGEYYNRLYDGDDMALNEFRKACEAAFPSPSDWTIYSEQRTVYAIIRINHAEVLVIGRNHSHNITAMNNRLSLMRVPFEIASITGHLMDGVELAQIEPVP